MDVNLYMNNKAGIIGVGSYFPSKTLDNSYFEEILDTNDEWIKTRMGISERKIAKQFVENNTY